MKHKLLAEKTNSQRLSIDSLLQLDNGPPLPSGWEKCLDLRSGVVYFKNRISGVKSYRLPLQLVEQNLCILETPKAENATASQVQCNSLNLELALGPMNAGNYSSNPRQKEPKEEDLELRLRLPGAAVINTVRLNESMQSSVSLERQLTGLLAEPAAAGAVAPTPVAPRTSNSSSSSSPSSSTTQVEDIVASEAESRKGKRPRRRADCSQVMVTVGCRECLMYVMLSKDDPRCPKCGNTVLLDFHSKAQHEDNPFCWSHNITCT